VLIKSACAAGALFLLALPGWAFAQDRHCPNDPHALGVSRVIEVDLAGSPRVGTF
jgi:hypothetical protein